MKNELRKRVEGYLKIRKNKRRICIMISLLSVVVIAAVYASLTLPAISMATDEPVLEASPSVAVLGGELSVHVTARAPLGEKESVFALHSQGNGSGLSERFAFDEEDVCIIQDEYGSIIELHRNRAEEGKADFWFSLAPGQETAFVLGFNSDRWAPPDIKVRPGKPGDAEASGSSESVSVTEPTEQESVSEPSSSSEPSEVPEASDEIPSETPGTSEELPGISEEHPETLPAASEETPETLPGTSEVIPGTSEEMPETPGMPETLPSTSETVPETSDVPNEIPEETGVPSEAPTGTEAQEPAEPETLPPAEPTTVEKGTDAPVPTEKPIASEEKPTEIPETTDKIPSGISEILNSMPDFFLGTQNMFAKMPALPEEIPGTSAEIPNTTEVIPDISVEITTETESPAETPAATETQPPTETETYPSSEPESRPTEGTTVPTAEEPTVPSAEEPTVPTAEEPTVPSAEEPTVPSAEEPTVPSAEEPTVPSAEEPTIPSSEEPGSELPPENTDSTDPGVPSDGLPDIELPTEVTGSTEPETPSAEESSEGISGDISEELPPEEAVTEPNLDFMAEAGESQYLIIWAGMGGDYTGALGAAEARIKPLQLIWKDHLEERVLTAETDTGIIITMRGLENAFPSGDLVLVAEELISNTVTDTTEAVYPTEATETIETTEVTNATEATEATNTTEAADATEAADTTNTTEAADTTEATDTTEAADTTETTEPTDTTEAADTTEATEATDTTEAAETVNTANAAEAESEGYTEPSSGSESVMPGTETTEIGEIADNVEWPENPAPIFQEDALKRLDQAAREAGMNPVEMRLFDIRLMRDGEEVEPIGTVTVTFSGLTKEEMPENSETRIFHIDEASDTATDMDASMDQYGDLIMETDHFSIYGAAISGTVQNSVTLDDLLEGFGIAGRFAVFANAMDARTHMQGSIAVKDVKLVGDNFVISPDSNGNAPDSSSVTLTIKKAVLGTEPPDTVYRFGIYNERGQQIRTASIVGAGSVEVSRLSSGSYRVYELDESGNKLEQGEGEGFTVSYDALNLNGDLSGGGTGANYNKTNYIENFISGTVRSFHVDNGYLYVGAANGIDGKTVKSSAAGDIEVVNVTAINQPTNIDWEAEFQRLEELSGTLAACADSYNCYNTTTSGVFVENISVPRNGKVTKAVIADSIGCNDRNLNSGIPLGSNQYLVINLDCSAVPAGTPVTLPNVAPNMNNAGGFNMDYSRLIWNFVSKDSCYAGTVQMEEGLAAGVILVPDGIMNQNGQLSGAIIADKVIRGGNEIHQCSFRLNSRIQTTVTNTYGVMEGDTSVTVTKEWSDGSEKHSDDKVTIYLLANGVRTGSIELSQRNDWTHIWPGLPRTGEDGMPITYSVEEEPMEGYYTSVTGGTAEIAGKWVRKNNFSDGGTYLLMNRNSGNALASAGNSSNLKPENVADSITEDKEVTPTAMWTAHGDDTSGYTLANAADTDRGLGLFWESNNYKIYAAKESQPYSNRFYYSSGGRIYAKYGYYTCYISNIPSNGGASVVSNSEYNGLPFELWEWQEDSGTSWSFTVTNNREADIPNKQTLEIQKTIDALRPGTGTDNPDTGLDNSIGDMTDLYRLYLDLKAEMIGAPADVVLVLDNSNSMQEPDMDRRRRSDVVVETAEQFAKDILESDKRNRISVVGYSGTWKYGLMEDGNGPDPVAYTNGSQDAWSVSGWTDQYEKLRGADLEPLRDDVLLKKPGGDKSGTNIMQALKVAGDLLKQSKSSKPEAHRYMIFISDGYPTYYYLTAKTKGVTKNNYYRNQYTYSPTANKKVVFTSTNYDCESTFEAGYWGRFGTGATQSGDFARQPTIDYAHKFHTVNDDTIVYSLGVGSEADSDSPLMVDTLKEITTDEDKNYYFATDSQAIKDAFNSILYGRPVSGVSITDELSQYVEWYGEQPDVLVTMEDKQGNVTQLWQGSGRETAGGIGKPLPGNTTEEGKPIISKVIFTPAAAGDTDKTTGKISVLFDSAYTLVPENTYTLSFNVKTAKTAYDDFADKLQAGENGYGGMTGDPDTDYASNDTSSDLPGFRSNYDAEAGYVIDGLHYTQAYDHPVIQVAACSLAIRKIDGADDSKLLAGAEFDLYRAVPKGSEGGVPIPGLGDVYGVKINEGPLVTGESGEIKVTDLAPDEYYLIETKAPTGYQPLEWPVHFRLVPGELAVLGDASVQNIAFCGDPAEGNLPTLVIRNTSGYQIPATGGAGTFLFTVCGLLVMAGAAGFLFIRWRRERGQFKP